MAQNGLVRLAVEACERAGVVGADVVGIDKVADIVRFGEAREGVWWLRVVKGHARCGGPRGAEYARAGKEVGYDRHDEEDKQGEERDEGAGEALRLLRLLWVLLLGVSRTSARSTTAELMDADAGAAAHVEDKSFIKA